MNKTVDIVIIGLNAEKTLQRCIESIKENSYSQNLITIIYSDGGSIDNSVKIAESIEGVKVVKLKLEHPTPGKQRNEGWKSGKAEYVQFVDSDTIVDIDWIKTAVEELNRGEAGAVCGDRREMYPEKSIYNWIGDNEWNAKPGYIKYFGGDVMVKRELLEKTGGYNDNLIAGEDPELAYRAGKEGYKIKKINALMTKHDLAMYKVKQYWKRAYRTGHAYAEVNKMHRDMWYDDYERIIKRGGIGLIGSIVGALFATITPYFIFITLLSIGVLFRPRIMLVNYFKSEMNLTKKEAKIYAIHASVVVIPQLFGILRYKLGKTFERPLRNRAKQLSTGGIK